MQRRTQTELVRVEDVVYVERESTYVHVHANERVDIIREWMNTFDHRLATRKFCHLHRSTIVNLGRPEAFEPTS